MEICGNICIRKKTCSFILKCSHCNIEIAVERWQDFVQHIINLHTTNNDTWLNEFVNNGNNWTPSTIACIRDISYSLNDPLEECTAANEVKMDIDDIKSKISKTVNNIDNEDILMKFGMFEESTPDPVEYGNDEEDEIKSATSLTSESMTSSSSNDDSIDNLNVTSESENTSKKVPATKFTLTLYRRNERTLKFIEIYKSLPCLWNPNDMNYKKFIEETEAFQTIISKMRNKCNIIIKPRSIKTAITRLHTQYAALLYQKKKNDQKLSETALEYIDKCSFLNNTNVRQMTKESDNINKVLIFSSINDGTTAFIEAYKKCSLLYNSKHSEYANLEKRRKCFETISNKLQSINIDISVDETMDTIRSLKHWYIKTVDRIKDDLNSLDTDAEKFYLKKCSFLSKSMLKDKLPCKVCEKVFLTDITLQGHMATKHNIGEMPFKCIECNRGFDMKHKMTIHIQRKHQEREYQCIYCERKFAIENELKLHIRTHTGHKPYVCEQCGKAFRVKTQLGYHINAIHTKIRAFKCTMCPKDFLKNRDLTDHIKAHLNIRDKICETCGKGFTNCHSLIRHRQIHAEVKKFACKLCDARFFQFVGLNSHMKRTHNIVRDKPKEGDIN